MDEEESGRGRGKNKFFWTEEEVQVLIQVLQEMACDPLWKTDSWFKSNYMIEVHRRIIEIMPKFSKKVNPHLESKIKWLKNKFHCINDMLRESDCQWNDVEKKIACEKQWFDSYCQTYKEAKGMWEFKFPYLNQLELVYERDRATGLNVQGYVDAVRNMENDQNTVSGGEYIGEYDLLSDEENNDVYSDSQATTTYASNTNVRNVSAKQKQPSSNSGGNIAKRKKMSSISASLDVGAQLQEINSNFRTFVEGFNSNFATMANAIADKNLRDKVASERMKDVIEELMKIGLPSGDVFKASNIFSSNKDKIDVFLSLPVDMRRLYVLSLF